MGNYSSSCSCYFPMQHKTSKSKTARVMDSMGNLLRQVNVPVKAAEIMLEEPGNVVCPVEQIRLTSRIVALRAEDELLGGKLYMLLPLSRIHCRVSEPEKRFIEAALVAACKKRTIGSSSTKNKKRKAGAKVLPTATVEMTKDEEEKARARDGTDSEVSVFGGNDAGLTSYRSGNQRPWTPVLEPISEEYF